MMDQSQENHGRLRKLLDELLASKNGKVLQHVCIGAENDM